MEAAQRPTSVSRRGTVASVADLPPAGNPIVAFVPSTPGLAFLDALVWYRTKAMVPSASVRSFVLIAREMCWAVTTIFAMEAAQTR